MFNQLAYDPKGHKIYVGRRREKHNNACLCCNVGLEAKFINPTVQ
jgi:hypothetical protein